MIYSSAQIAETVLSNTLFATAGVFQDVLGLGHGLEAYKCSKTSCHWLENKFVFWLVKKENNQTQNFLELLA